MIIIRVEPPTIIPKEIPKLLYDSLILDRLEDKSGDGVGVDFIEGSGGVIVALGLLRYFRQSKATTIPGIMPRKILNRIPINSRLVVPSRNIISVRIVKATAQIQPMASPTISKIFFVF